MTKNPKPKSKERLISDYLNNNIKKLLSDPRFISDAVNRMDKSDEDFIDYKLRIPKPKKWGDSFRKKDL